MDGVRGLAILCVLTYHYFCAGIQAPPHSWQSYVLIPLESLRTGVDLFFVLSGFLIGGILLDTRGDANYYKTFYGRRAFRILPAYAATIAIFLAGVYLAGHTGGSRLGPIFNRDVPLWSYPVFLQNFFMAVQGTSGPWWMGPTWSLAVEEQFYLLLPFVVRRLTSAGVLRLVVIVILGAPLLRMVCVQAGMPIGAEVLLPCRGDSLGAGVLIALLVRHEAASQWLLSNRRGLYALLGTGLVAGVGLFAATKGASVLRTGYGGSVLTASYVALLLLLIFKPARLESAVFRSAIPVAAGQLSFCVYLVHHGLNPLIQTALLGKVGIYSWSSLAVTCLALVVTLSIAAVSWRYFEGPLIRYARSRFRYQTLASAPRAALIGR